MTVTASCAKIARCIALESSMKPLTSHEGLHCANCGVPMHGEFCHACGQSTHSVLKPMHHMVEETVETVLHIDGRIVHTLPPLLLKPGFLTLEFFSGRRVRYIAPFRLMFVLCVLSFFVFHLAIDQLSSKVGTSGFPLVSVNGSRDQRHGQSVQRCQHPGCRSSCHGLQKLTARATGAPPNLLDQTNVAARDLRQKASRRLIRLNSRCVNRISATTSIVLGVGSLGDVALKPADAMKVAGPVPDDNGHEAVGQESTPVRIAWLPDMVNARLTELGKHIQDNMHALKRGDPVAARRPSNG